MRYILLLLPARALSGGFFLLLSLTTLTRYTQHYCITIRRIDRRTLIFTIVNVITNQMYIITVKSNKHIITDSFINTLWVRCLFCRKQKIIYFIRMFCLLHGILLLRLCSNKITGRWKLLTPVQPQNW